MTPSQRKFAKTDKAKAISRRYHQSEKGKTTRRTRQRRYRAANPEFYRAKDKAYAKAHPGYVKAKNLWAKYRITLVSWVNLFHLQNERCKICKTDKAGARNWATDHDHQTGRVRGILCHKCNMVLGCLGDSITGVQDAARTIMTYLAEPVYRTPDGKKCAPDAPGARLALWKPKIGPYAVEE